MVPFSANKWSPFRLTNTKADVDEIRRIRIDHFGSNPKSTVSHKQVFQRTAQADPQLAVMGVNDRQTVTFPVTATAA